MRSLARLEPGDSIAIVSPSWGGAAVFPDRLKRAMRAFESATGLQPLLMPNAVKNLDWRSATARERAQDINQAFADNTFSGILCTIGGDHAAQVLPLLDYQLISRRPKVFCGYSDITVLHHALYSVSGLTTWYGPALLPQFGEPGGPDPYTVDHFLAMTMKPGQGGVISRSPYLIDEYVDWSEETGELRERIPAPERLVLRAGAGEGPLLAGCLPSAREVLGTPWQPVYAGHVFFVDIPDGRYRIADADRDLTHLRNARALDELAAMVIGRPRSFSASDRAKLYRIVLESVADFRYPVIAEFECGHTDPMTTLPIGLRCSIEGDEVTLFNDASSQTPLRGSSATAAAPPTLTNERNRND